MLVPVLEELEDDDELEDDEVSRLEDVKIAVVSNIRY